MVYRILQKYNSVNRLTIIINLLLIKMLFSGKNLRFIQYKPVLLH
ncbi:hypothetical protein EMA8858_01716 [Emticicia aquatica]|uniref:Uncharacterized protein n=1 Tax=Emticicia aquatica TaxID=1681835 RepID=A0ABM9AP89_9BACT|nr:hypothetical protein EMA8858_01716 [Emticicia aquatica]